MPPKKIPEVPRWTHEADGGSLLSVDDYTLPRSMILRLAKGVLPANTQIQKDALTAILKSTTVFVNYLASNADDRAQLANKKTIRPEDVFGALEEVEFGGFVQRVELELQKYQDIQNNKRNDYRRRVKEDQDQNQSGNPSAVEHDMDSASVVSQREEKSTTPRVVTLGNSAEGSNLDTDDDAADKPPAAKKARTSNAGSSRANGPGRLSGFTDGDADDDTANVADDDDDDDLDDLEYQSAEEDLPDEEVEDDDVQADDDVGDTLDSGMGAMNPDPDDDDDDDAAASDDE